LLVKRWHSIFKHRLWTPCAATYSRATEGRAHVPLANCSRSEGKVASPNCLSYRLQFKDGSFDEIPLSETVLITPEQRNTSGSVLVTSPTIPCGCGKEAVGLSMRKA